MGTILEVPSGYWALLVAFLSVIVVIIEKFGTLLTWLGIRPAKESELKALALQNEEDHRRMRETVGALRTDNEAAHRDFHRDNESDHKELRRDLQEIGKGLARIEGKLEGRK